MSTADKTNIYTSQDSIYFDGVVTAPSVETYKIGAKGSIAGVNLAAAGIDVGSRWRFSSSWKPILFWT